MNVEDALRKEIKEEYCADILEHKFAGFRDVHRVQGGEKTHWLALDFHVLLDPTQVKNGEPHKFDAVEWFYIDSLPEPLHSQAGSALEKFRETLG
jgi:ADP-ribose pyrophosphatase YjhB (NUDIX family)